MILSGWKEIAGHLRRGVRTVQRWESYGLPVRRPAGRSRSAVFAISEEIDRWAHSRPNGKPERKRFGNYLRPHPIVRIQETFSETEKLMEELRLRTAKQQQLLELLRQESQRRRLERSRVATAPVVEIRRGFTPMDTA
jgi:phage terminase Nu1 subunit (DNA packaging protein)